MDILGIKDTERIETDMKKMKLGICIVLMLVLVVLGAGVCYWYENLRSETKQGGILVYEHNHVCPSQQKC